MTCWSTDKSNYRNQYPLAKNGVITPTIRPLEQALRVSACPIIGTKWYILAETLIDSNCETDYATTYR